MGEIVEFPSNGTTGQGYLAVPESGSGPGVMVIQEWWGLVPHIKGVADRFAGAGFVALAPDLYHGETTFEPDEAGKLMMALNLAKAGQDLSGAVDFLAGRSTASGIGVVGFCMGGGLALMVASQRPDKVNAVVPFYGAIPWEGAQPDLTAISAAVQGHYASEDDWATPEVARQLEADLRAAGKQAEVFIYPECPHAFFNDDRPDVYHAEAAAAAWARTVTFLNLQLA
jgi:carboxymethylenebutenolidase